MDKTEEQYCDKLKLQKKGFMHDLLTGKGMDRGCPQNYKFLLMT